MNICMHTHIFIVSHHSYHASCKPPHPTPHTTLFADRPLSPTPTRGRRNKMLCRAEEPMVAMSEMWT